MKNINTLMRNYPNIINIKTRENMKFKPGIECAIISVNEPQLDRCIDSANKQEVPFANIKHFNKIIPLAKAFNKAITSCEHEYMLFLSGDIILFPSATRIILNAVGKNKINLRTVYNFKFGVFDTFLMDTLTGFKLYRTEIARDILFDEETLRDDIKARELAKTKGAEEICLYKKENAVLGIHCDDPTKKQVFIRFYIDGCKMRNLHNSTGRFFDRTLLQLEKISLVYPNDDRYGVGIKAWKEGYKNNDYEGSHNYLKEDKIYERYFKEK